MDILWLFLVIILKDFKHNIMRIVEGLVAASFISLDRLFILGIHTFKHTTTHIAISKITTIMGP